MLLACLGIAIGAGGLTAVVIVMLTAQSTMDAASQRKTNNRLVRGVRRSG